MPRTILLLALACLASACDPTLLGPAPGALRVHGVVGQGDLYLDAIDRGPVQSAQLFGGLAPGAHVIELRRAGVAVAAHAVEVRPGMLLDTRIDAPIAASATSSIAPLPIPASPAPPRTTSRNTHADAAPLPAETTTPAPLPPATITRATTPEPAALPAETITRATTPEPAALPAETTTRATPPEPAALPADTATRSTAHHGSPPRAPTRRDPPSDRRSPPASPRAAELDPLLLRALDEDRAVRAQRAAERDAELAREADRARERERAELAAALAALPEQPSRADVQAAIQTILPDIARCVGRGGPGTAIITFDVAGDTGRPRRTSVRGPYAGTPIGTCIEGVSRTASFGEFRRTTYVVSYPVRF